MHPSTWHLEKADVYTTGCTYVAHCAIAFRGSGNAVASTAYVDLAHACQSRSFGAHSRSEMHKSHVDQRIRNLPVGRGNAAPEE
jgi:hypothetical protein